MTNEEPSGAGSQSTPPPPQIPSYQTAAPQNPPQYQTQASPYPPQPGQYDLRPRDPDPRGRNVLALVAFIVSIVGFVFACIPGALIVGWVLLPIAFVLALVSLFLRGSGKGLGIAGLIISVVGTVVGFVVFFAVVATSVNAAFNDSTVVTQPGNGSAANPPAQQQPSNEVGTRSNPAPLGATLSTDDWTVVINSYTTDGDAIVAAANQFNDDPPAGSHYEIVNYTVTYTGKDSSYAAEVQVDVVTSSGNVIDSYSHLVVLDDSMGLSELFTGGSATGSAAFLVPDGQTVLIRVEPGILADSVFVAP